MGKLSRAPSSPHGRRLERFALAGFALTSLLLLAACQTASVDEALTLDSALQTGGDISAEDLEAGQTQFRSGNYGLAEKHFRKAVELRASNIAAWMGLAASYDHLGRFELADRAYEQLLKLAGRQPRIINNMGYSQFLRGDRKEARKLLLEAKSALHDDPVVAANLALLDRQ